MTISEEPKSATEPTGAVDDHDVIDLDDVEGHGLREVAAGLGAAAVLAGGGTAAAAAVGVHPTLPHLNNPSPSISDPVGTVDRTTDWGIATSRDARDGALGTAATTAADAVSLAGREVTATSTTAGAVVRGAEQTAGTLVDAAGSTTRTEVAAASRTVGAEEHVALTTVRSDAAGVTTTAATTADDATRKAATVLHLTTSTVNALETTITATVENLNPQAGAGTSGMGSTGWVTFSLGGETIASVQLSNGQATITVKTASLGGKVLQAVYSGSATDASSMLSMTL